MQKYLTLDEAKSTINCSKSMLGKVFTFFFFFASMDHEVEICVQEVKSDGVESVDQFKEDNPDEFLQGTETRVKHSGKTSQML